MKTTNKMIAAAIATAFVVPTITFADYEGSSLTDESGLWSKMTKRVEMMMDGDRSGKSEFSQSYANRKGDGESFNHGRGFGGDREKMAKKGMERGGMKGGKQGGLLEVFGVELSEEDQDAMEEARQELMDQFKENRKDLFTQLRAASDSDARSVIRTEIKELMAEHREAQNTIREEYKEKLDAMLPAEVKEALDQHKADMDALQADYKEDLDALKTKIEAETDEDTKRELYQKYRDLREENRDLMRELQDDFRETMDALIEQYGVETEESDA